MPSKLHLSKDAADYGAGSKTEHCGICVHFESPASCEIVDGKIRAGARCREFKLDKDKED